MQIFLCLYFHIYFFANIFIFYSVQIDTVSLILYNKLINTAWLWGKSMKNDKIIKIIRVAKKYYESHMDQKIIAQEEDISVSTVSRMLKKAEEMGYIKITVEYPVLSNEELSASLKKKYNLEKVFLVPKLSDAPVAVQEDVCRAAAKDLSSYLNDGSIIGTAWGRTMKSFANYVSDLGVHNVKVVQINGKTNETSVPVGADDLSQAIARAGHGEAYVIPAPVAVDSAEIAEMLKKERNISAALTLARECQIALFGVGNLSRNTILYRSGSLKEEDFIELEEKGAVGDVCTCFFDARGEAVSSSFAKRRISITLEELKKIPCKIGVASGLEKKEALHAALLGEYINILYADEELGKELIAI